MTPVFAFTAHRSPSHRAQSLENPVPDAKIAQVYGSAIPKPLLEAQRLAGGIFAWGMPDRKYVGEMAQGDVVLSYFDDAYKHVARVVAKHHDPKLAAAIWDPPHEGTRPYAHMFFMTKPLSVTRRVRWNDAPQLFDQLPSGVVQVEPGKIGAILEEFETIEAFISAHFGVDLGALGSPLHIIPTSTQSTPPAIDLAEPTATLRYLVETYRILRDTALGRGLKVLHNYTCQICGETLEVPGGARYAEVHHVKPLGQPHMGPDVPENILVLCPNDHARCDLGCIKLSSQKLRLHPSHRVGEEFIAYHNTNVYRRNATA